MKRTFWIVFLALGILVSCTDRDDNVNLVNIRIQNSTEQFFTEVRINQQDTIYENIAAGDFSGYLEFEEAYQAAAITVVTDSMSINYFPSEIPVDSLPIGFYTYELFFNETNELQLNFKIDE